MYEDPPPPSIIETYRSSRRQSRRATLTPPLSPFDLEGVPLVSSQNEKYLQVDSGQMQSRAPSRSDSLFDRIFPPLAPRSDTDRSSRYDAGSGIPSSQSHRTHVQLGALPVVLSRSVDASRVPEVTLRNTEPLSPPLPVVRTHTPSRTIHPHPPPSDRRGEERRQSRHRRESAKVYTLNISPPTQPSIPSPQLVSSPASRQTIVVGGSPRIRGSSRQDTSHELGYNASHPVLHSSRDRSMSYVGSPPIPSASHEPSTRRSTHSRHSYSPQSTRHHNVKTNRRYSAPLESIPQDHVLPQTPISSATPVQMPRPSFNVGRREPDLPSHRQSTAYPLAVHKSTPANRTVGVAGVARWDPSNLWDPLANRPR